MIRTFRVGAVAMLALLVAASAAEAQGGGARGGGRGGGGRGGVGMLMQNITVDAAVQLKLDTLATKFQEDQNKLRAEYNLPPIVAGARGGRGGGGATPPPAEYVTKNTELQGKYFDSVKALLTPDQQKVFDENRANMGRGRRGGGE